MRLDLLPRARQSATRTLAGQSQVWCAVRSQWLAATPEEFVRQGLIGELVARGYPASWMHVERAVGTGRVRLDLLVLDRRGRAFLLAETKAPGHDLGPAIRQLADYNRHWSAPYVLAVNGEAAICCRLDFAAETLAPLANLPAYPQ